MVVGFTTTCAISADNHKPSEFEFHSWRGVLIEGEMLLLGGSWLQFSNVDFLEPNGKETIKPSIGKGRLCLTNQRLLLLSADVDSGECRFEITRKHILFCFYILCLFC
jgi:hypothetical protein